MSTPVFAIVRNGKIEPMTPIDLPEGTRLLILPNPSAKVDDDRIMQLFLDFITTEALKNNILVPYTIALSKTAHSLIAGIELD